MDSPAGQPAPRAAVVRVLLVLALVTAAYLPTFGAGFVWDDDDNVTENQTLRTASGLAKIWSEPLANQQFYPLTHTSFWLQYQLHGLDPLPYHLLNVLLHAGVALLLWRLLRLLSVPGPWLAAAVFAVHPVHVESVAWITERKNVLSGVFYLATALAFLKWAGLASKLRGPDHGAQPDHGAPPRFRAGYLLALLFFVCALASKTVTCTLPAALLIILGWKKPPAWKSSALALLPFFAVGAVAGLATSWIEKNHLNITWSTPWLDRCLIAGRAFFFYLGKLVWPSELVFIYPRWQIDPTSAWQYLFPFAVLLVAIMAFVLRRRIGWTPLVALGYYAVTLAPAMGFFTLAYHRFSYVQDHFDYLASMGPLALGTAGLSVFGNWLVKRRPRISPVALPALAGLLLVALTVRSAIQCRPFHDYESLFRHTLAGNPTAALAHHNLAVLLGRTGRTDEALLHYREAIRLAPTEPQVYDNLGGLLLATGRFSEATEARSTAARMLPGSANTRYQLGLAFLQSSRPAQAIAAWDDALGIRPNWTRVERLIAGTYASAPEVRDGKKAVAYAEAACSHTKRNFAACFEVLASAYTADGRVSDAKEAARRATALVPSATRGVPDKDDP